MFGKSLIRDRKPRKTRRVILETLETRRLPATTGIAAHVLHRVSPLMAKATPSAPPVPLTANSSDTSSITVPLSIVNVGDRKRLGVQLSVAGSPLRTYLLDTGSTGLYVAKYGLHKSDYVLTSRTFAQKYSSNIGYSGPVAKTTISFATGPTTSGVYLGLIKKTNIPGWKSKLRHGEAPYDNAFYGTLGMSLAPGAAKKQGSLYSIIAQLPGNLNSGFIIHTGGINGQSPTLTIGLTADNTQGFTTVQMPPAYPSNGATQPSPYTYGNGFKNHVIAWNDKGVSVNYSISQMPSFSAKTIFDTGEALTTLYTTNVPSNLQSGGDLIDKLLFQADLTSKTTWRFHTGQTANVDQVHVNPKKRETVNTGIGLFFNDDVMYDLADGTIGFRLICSGG